jgi:hypothetical protein
MAWRPAGMEDSRWHRLCTSHEAEILLTQEQIIRLNEAAGVSLDGSADVT